MIAIIVSIIVIILIAFLVWYFTRTPVTKEDPKTTGNDSTDVSDNTVITKSGLDNTKVIRLTGDMSNPDEPVNKDGYKKSALDNAMILYKKGNAYFDTSLVKGVPCMMDSIDGSIIYLGEFMERESVLIEAIANNCYAFSWFRTDDKWNNTAYGLKGDPKNYVHTDQKHVESWVYVG